MFNDGANGKGRRGSLMRKCHEIHQSIAKVFIDGTHSTCEALSYYERPTERSNQPIEGSNKSKNSINRELTNNGKNTFESYIELGKVLEKQSCNRYEELRKGAAYKQKNASCRTRDNIIRSIVKGHKTGKYSVRDYWAKIVSVLGNYDLPGEVQRQMRN